MDGLRLYLRLMGAQLRGLMQYKLSFLTDAAASGLGMLMEFAGVVVLFAHTPLIGGWTLPEIALLYGTAELSLALARGLMDGVDAFPEMVRLGRFDGVLVRPRNPFLQVMGSKVSLRHLGRIAQGALVLGLALAWLGVDWGLERWAFLAWTVLGGVLFFAGLFTIGSTFSFWTVEPLEAFNILTYGGGAMASYPMNIYAEWLRNVFVFIVPLAFVNYIPALWLLGRPDPLGLPAFAPALAFPLCALVLGVGLWFWGFGVRRYQSTGS